MTNWDPTEHKGYIEVDRIFTEDLNWPVRKINDPDTGVDRLVEVAGKPISTAPGRISVTGRLLGLQIKSGKSFFKEKIGDSYIYRASKKEYKYWVNYSVPVLLVLHNPKDRTTIWQVVKTKTARLSGKKYRIDVPISNKLDASSKSELTKLAANISPSDAIRMKRELFEDQDPRFRIKIFANEEKEFFEITARNEPVSIRLSLRVSPEKFRRLFDDGEAIGFDPGEAIQFEGSPLFDELNRLDPIGVTFRSSSLVETWLNIGVVGDQGSIVASLPPIRFMVSAGRINATCTGEGCDQLVTVDFKTPVDGSAPSAPPRIRFHFLKLKGLKVKDIPDLGPILRFLEAARKSARIRAVCSYQGNLLFQTDANAKAASFDLIFSIYEALARSRTLARTVGWDTQIKKINQLAIVQANRIYELYSQGQSVEPAKFVRAKLQATLTRDGAEISGANNGKYVQFAFEGEGPHAMPFWGDEVNVQPVILVLTNAKSSISKIDLKKKAGERIQIKIVGSESCDIVRRRERLEIKLD